jgi:integration host factor subunit alpha
MSQKLSEKRSTADIPASPPDDRVSDASRTVTRADLSDAVHRRIGLSRAESAEFVEMVLTEIFQAIVAGEDVKLSSFGSFHIRWKNERVGRNPKTGEAAPISARRVVMFKASNVLRARINGHRSIDRKI